MSQTKLTNHTNLGITLALYLANDEYDHSPSDIPDDGLPIISATRLLMPAKALVLAHRLPAKDNTVDVADRVKSRMGQSIHTGIETAFTGPNRDRLLVELGYPEKLIQNIRINPTEAELTQNPNIVPIYLEQRAYRVIELSDGTKVRVSGKFDQVTDGKVEDNKTTSTYKYGKLDQTEIGEYSKQLSIYRWLNPKIITGNVGQINFIFTDWKAGELSRTQNYPPKAAMEVPINLMGLSDTERFIKRRIEMMLEANKATSQDDMPRCTDEELWKSPDTYKYYSKQETADKGGRSTKNFSTFSEAQLHKTRAGKGTIVVAPGVPKRCSYCDAAPLCSQRLEYDI